MESLGPSLPVLSGRYDAPNPQSLAHVLIGRGFGGITGNLAGGVVLERTPKRANCLLGSAGLALASINALVPQAGGGSGVLGLLLFARGLAATIVNVVVTLCIIRIWSGDSRSATAALNTQNFAWGVGALLAPVLMRSAGLDNTSIDSSYLALSGFALFTICWAFFLKSPLSEAKSNPNAKQKGKGSSETQSALPVQLVPRALMFKPAVWLFLYYFSYESAQMVTGDWLATIATQVLNTTANTGAELTAVFWSALAFGRLCSVPLMRCMDEIQMTKLCFATALAFAAILLAAVVVSSLPAAYIGASGVGLGLSALHPAGLVLAKKTFKLNEHVLGQVLVGGSIGQLMVPAAVGAAMLWSPQIFGYAIVLLVTIQLTSFKFLLSLKKRVSELQEQEQFELPIL